MSNEEMYYVYLKTLIERGKFFADNLISEKSRQLYLNPLAALSDYP